MLSAKENIPAAKMHLRYRKEGDYGQLRPYVSPVEYIGSKTKPGTCELCVFGTGEVHSDFCVTRTPVQINLELS